MMKTIVLVVTTIRARNTELLLDGTGNTGPVHEAAVRSKCDISNMTG
jgi:hypothetical protein